MKRPQCRAPFGRTRREPEVAQMLRVFEAQLLADECDVSPYHFKSQKCPRSEVNVLMIVPGYSFVIVLHHGREYGQNLRQKGSSTVPRAWNALSCPPLLMATAAPSEDRSAPLKLTAFSHARRRLTRT